MPIFDIVIISIITLAFLAFAVVLAWGDYQTREIAQASRERALRGARVDTPKQSTGPENVGRSVPEKSKAPAHA
jgi:hypothetical protein